jgi:hypothetical protein
LGVAFCGRLAPDRAACRQNRSRCG